ncbi:hypothetical protein G1H11_23840 [Phytoactinopolyspora alkaliphila]|uniref:Uncharacterized protein n=1 Tax=Phytoactinopolyspora alkaliphila TaxID=1783498 RepID=A0A6N9YTT0_9ACTN|nr:hypothetical protein [Phytoactinopolyspora alkaliphila]NED98337.1 hypothetical protein [Phytoactinopolyspora alkaliphila]
MTIELTIAQRRLWWHGDEHSPAPEDWHVSADIWALSAHPPGDRHVGDLSLTVAALGREPHALDTMALSEWALAFLNEAHAAEAGTLPPDLDWVTPGPERIVVVRQLEVAPGWRGLSAGATLLASALSAFVPSARLAIAQESAAAPSDVHDAEAAAITAARWATLLRRTGFRERGSVHVLDLHDPALSTARRAMIDGAMNDGAGIDGEGGEGDTARD